MPRGTIPRRERLAFLSALVKEKGEVRSSAYPDMARRLRISAAQFRRDLKRLDDEGVVRYRHGYAEHVPTAERLRLDAIDPAVSLGRR